MAVCRWGGAKAIGQRSVCAGRFVSLFLLVLSCLIAVGGGGAPVHAQSTEDAGGASYITPFPGGDTYRLGVVGDHLAEGVNYALLEGLGGDARVAIERRNVPLPGFSRPDFAEQIRDAARAVTDAKLHVCAVVVGAQDRWALRLPDGRRLAVGSREWREAYGERVDSLMKALKGAGAAVYWVGLPIMRRGEPDEAARAINEVVRERAYLAGVKYIDVYQGFAGEDGEYSPYGPDITGKMRLLRLSDGVHMTGAGYAKLAHFVEREVKRDLAQAKNERAVPLAGNEAEQAIINPTAHVPQWQTVSDAASTDARPTGASAPSEGGGQQAETSRISLRTLDGEGREQMVPIDIVRPAIPSAVILAVTKRESADRASQMGDQILEQLPGGLTVMSSITPSGDAPSGPGRRKVSAAQTPYFRVLVKGERIAFREGRADDISWPRPDPALALPPEVPKSESEPAAGEDFGIPLPVPNPRFVR